MMLTIALAIGAAVTLAVVTSGFLHFNYRRGMSEADTAWQGLIDRTPAPMRTFDPRSIETMPEIARRYFGHAIAPGTLLSRLAEIEMSGTFSLGTKAQPMPYAMTARQLIAAPHAFVWIASMHSGPAWIAGSDALIDDVGWTRFWLGGLLQVANDGFSEDFLRSAVARPALEAIWAPASLLPERGVRWTAAGLDAADVVIPTTHGEVTINLVLEKSGKVKQVSTLRWTNANSQKVFAYQPFGGTVEAETTFGGYTVPSAVSIGNMFGTGDYFPFFEAQISAIKYR
ncbi:MAG: DUF6544 family protein [Devosia sp.]